MEFSRENSILTLLDVTTVATNGGHLQVVKEEKRKLTNSSRRKGIFELDSKCVCVPGPIRSSFRCPELHGTGCGNAFLLSQEVCSKRSTPHRLLP